MKTADIVCELKAADIGHRPKLAERSANQNVNPANNQKKKAMQVVPVVNIQPMKTNLLKQGKEAIAAQKMRNLRNLANQEAADAGAVRTFKNQKLVEQLSLRPVPPSVEQLSKQKHVLYNQRKTRDAGKKVALQAANCATEKAASSNKMAIRKEKMQHITSLLETQRALTQKLRATREKRTRNELSSFESEEVSNKRQKMNESMEIQRQAVDLFLNTEKENVPPRDHKKKRKTF